MKLWKQILGIVLSAVVVFSFTSCSSNGKMGKLQPTPAALSVPKQTKREQKQGDIFVSPNGDDAHNGTKENPVRTPQKAIELAQSLEKEDKVIYFASGEYNISAITFTQKDNGLTLFGEEGTVFNGGVTLNTADFTDYKDNIKMLDLKKYNITKEDIGEVRAFGQYNTAEKYGADGSLYCELFCDNQRMTLSRYPNTDEKNLRTGKITDNGDAKEIYTNKGTQQNPEWENLKNPRGGTFAAEKEVTSRMASWKNSDDIWIFGYFQYDWADSTTPLKSFDDSSITTEYASVYGFKEDAPYYFFNIFEELDAENEWYIDKEDLILYFIPPSDFESKPIQLSLETADLITFDNVSDITIDGITILGTRANAFFGTGSHISIKNCTIKNVGKNAVELEGEKITVENNIITATGKAGVVLTGGDRKTLTSAENTVINNLIYDWSQVYKTYQAAVALHGVGGVCSHNEIYNSPHEAVTYTGNNHIIEYNIIHDVVLKSSDAAAIYAGRSWSAYGNVIRYNCIYNLGSGEFTPCGIYFDDGFSGQTAYGNLLVNIPWCGFLIGGGRDISVTNNVIVNAGKPIVYDDRAIAGIVDNGWFTHSKTAESTLWKTLREVDVHAQPWVDAFPQLSRLSSDFDNTDNPAFAPNPADSIVEQNIIVGQKKYLGDIQKRVYQYSRVSDNPLYTFSENIFAGDGDYTLTVDTNNFEKLPYEKMGRVYQY